MPRIISISEIKKILDEEDINYPILVKRPNKSDLLIMNIDDYKRVIKNTNLY